MSNVARELDVHMSHPGPEHWNAFGRLIGYLKGKKTKGIMIRKPKILNAVICCDSNCATDKETGKSVSNLVTILVIKLRTFSPKTQWTIALSSIETEYVAISPCAQEVKFVEKLLQEMNGVQNRQFYNKETKTWSIPRCPL